ncbi:hypothetical protein [Streptomyces sp. CBMA123]|uniref:hypothetical protein n=1 Tax=Streptomyces sp. CBMA123 TaxID=1896313 RepID=UPI001661F391|nr:hypothetical protein [Streptomyces sp. CBMA123]
MRPYTLNDDDHSDQYAPSKVAHARAAQRRSWQQDALFELEDLGEIFGLSEATLKAVR